jgi:hypothetical protein
MQITSNKAHSTPKTTLSKEFEHLQDDDCENSIQIDSPLVVKTNDNYDTKPCKLSPIVNSNSQGILRNNKSLQQITLSQEAKKCVRFNSNHQLDNINRNLEFDDEDSNDKHPEKVNEDDSDLLEHLYQLEKCKKNVGQTEVSYNDDDDSNQTLVFDKSKTIDSNDIKIGFKTASEKSISINKSAFFNSKALDIIKESEDNDQNSFKKDIEMKSDNIKSDFVFANNKNYLISKSAINKVSNIDEEDEDIKGDIGVKKEVSKKENGPNTFKSDIEMKSDNIKSDFVFANNKNYLISKSAINKVSNIDEEDEDIKGDIGVKKEVSKKENGPNTFKSDIEMKSDNIKSDFVFANNKSYLISKIAINKVSNIDEEDEDIKGDIGVKKEVSKKENGPNTFKSDIEMKSDNIKSDFVFANNKNYLISKSAINKVSNIDEEDEDIKGDIGVKKEVSKKENGPNTFKSDIEMKSDNIKSDFVFANNKSYLISKSAINKVSNIDEEDEDIKGDIGVKKEVSKKENGPNTFKSDIEMKSDNIKSDFVFANNKSYLISKIAINKVSNIDEEDEDIKGDIGVKKEVSKKENGPNTFKSDIEMKSDNIKSDFVFANNKNYLISKSAINKVSNIDEEDEDIKGDIGVKKEVSKKENGPNTFKSDIEMKSDNIKSDFVFANNKNYLISKSAINKVSNIDEENEDIKGDIGVKKEVSKKENGPNTFKSDIEMKSDNIKSDFVFANNKSYLISKSAINKVSNIDEEDEDIKGDIEVKKEISIKNDDQINKSIQVISTNEKKLNNNNRKSIDPPNMSINQSANFLDNTSFLNSSKLNLSVNVSNKNATFEKRKSFTRVICYSKPKETITSIDESKKEEVEICMENLPKISESQETNSRPSSYTSNESTNSYVFSAEPNAPIIKLKDIRIEKSDNGMFIVKPIFELINLDSK